MSHDVIHTHAELVVVVLIASFIYIPSTTNTYYKHKVPVHCLSVIISYSVVNHMLLKLFQAHQISKHHCLFAYVWYSAVIFCLQRWMIERVGLAVLGVVLLYFVGSHSNVIRLNWMMVFPRQTVKLTVTNGIGWLWWFKEPYWLLLSFTLHVCLPGSCDVLFVYQRIQNHIWWGNKNARNSWSKLKCSNDVCECFFPAQELQFFFSTRFILPTWLQNA